MQQNQGGRQACSLLLLLSIVNTGNQSFAQKSKSASCMRADLRLKLDESATLACGCCCCSDFDIADGASILELDPACDACTMERVAGMAVGESHVVDSGVRPSVGGVERQAGGSSGS